MRRGWITSGRARMGCRPASISPLIYRSRRCSGPGIRRLPGAKHDPWQITDDPNAAKFRVQNLSLPAGFTVERLRTRQALLECVNAQQDRLSRVAESQALVDQQKAAFTLLTSGSFASAFEMDREPDAVRDRVRPPPVRAVAAAGAAAG